MTLAAQIAADVETVFLNTDDFGEEVSYTPAGGAARTIVVVIEPQPAEIRQEGSHLVEHRIVRVLAKVHATEGIITLSKGDSITWNGKVYSLYGDMDKQMGAFQPRFSCPTILNTGPSQGFRF